MPPPRGRACAHLAEIVERAARSAQRMANDPDEGRGGPVMRFVLSCFLLATIGASLGCADPSTDGGTSADTGAQAPTFQRASAVHAGHRRQASLPVAPDATHFMWQGVQTSFLDGTGQPCTGHVAIGVGDQAVCYASPAGELRCAGRIYTHDFGPAFTTVEGVEGVEQILVSSTFNSEDHDAVCVKTKAGEARCMGNDDDWGQFGTGATGPSNGFVFFGQVDDVVAIATGTWDQLCAVTKESGVFCAGYGFGTSPVSVASSATSFWVDTFGTARADDPSIYRAANSRTDAWVDANGGVFDFPPTYPGAPSPALYGPPGHVVDVTGNALYTPPGTGFPQPRSCWLDDAGAAWCAASDPNALPSPMPAPPVTTQVFTAHKVLALAGNFYATTLCAVYDDGSIACNGDNGAGQLGLDAPSYVDTETVVQPPGTIDLRCK
jgi:hypothetical protein